MKALMKTVILLLLLFVLLYIIYEGYDQCWTGFQGYTNNKGEFVPPKKLWDWLQLMIVPLLIAVGVWWLNKSQKKSEQQIETDRQRQKTIEDYFDCMADLLLKEHLRDVNNNQESRSIARTRTLAVLRVLDGSRKAQAIQFLYESGLIGKNPIVQLNGADLKDAKLDWATLRGCELRGVYFNKAQLRGANLKDADLRGSDFSRADLTEAYMINANLEQAILRRGKLRKTDLKGAVLKDVDFTDADLKDTKMPKPEPS